MQIAANFSKVTHLLLERTKNRQALIREKYLIGGSNLDDWKKTIDEKWESNLVGD